MQMSSVLHHLHPRIFSTLKFKPEPKFKLSVYPELAKAKLAGFVLLTTMTGYAMGTCPTTISSLAMVTTGTGLCIMSANSLNQWIESPFDTQMSRTRNRPIVRYAISPTHAFSTGIVSGVVGTGILASINPICAVLGFSNIVLYSGLYTMMKRTSIYNTWVGAIVGAIPPVIGWVANTGTIDVGSLLLAGINLINFSILVCMAVSPLQCPLLELTGRLFQSWIPNDVSFESQLECPSFAQIFLGNVSN